MTKHIADMTPEEHERVKASWRNRQSKCRANPLNRYRERRYDPRTRAAILESDRMRQRKHRQRP